MINLNLPIILSLSRIVLAFIFAFFLYHYFKFAAFGIYLLALLTDVLDGYLARKYKQITLLGRILDPAADRLLVILTFLILLVRYNLPLWLAILVISYHLITVICWLLIFKLKKITIEHTFWGKTNSFWQALLLFSVVFNFFPKIFFYTLVCTIIFASLSYLFEIIKILKKKTS
jgi:cardiolipin synthase